MSTAEPFALARRRGLVVGHWPALEALGVEAIVTTRQGGTSAGPYATLNLGLHVGDEDASVVENRRRALEALGCALEDAVFAQQVHGHRATVITPDDRGRGARELDGAVPASDALVTSSRGLALVVLVADCLPALLVDPEAGVLAVVHAGWRGTAAAAMVCAVAAAQRLGAEPARMHAVLGPAISAARYQVGAEVVAAVGQAPGGAPSGVAFEQPDGWHLDLVRANEHQLFGAGVPAEHVVKSGVSTDDERFFSDRRARPCGRFALLARLRP